MHRFFFIFCCTLFLQSCYYPERIKDGSTAFERKQYAVAAKLLDKEYNKTNATLDKAKKAFLIGQSYSAMNQNDQAVDWYKRAYDNQFGPEALKAYAYALKQAERYTEAAKVFEQVGREIGDPFTYRKEAEICSQAATWVELAKENEYQIETLDFNSSKKDYATALWKDEYLIFSSDRTDANGKEEYKWFGEKFSDLYQINLESKQLEALSESINSPYNEGSVSFSGDGNRIYFSRCGSDGKKGKDDYCRIYYAIKNNEGWSKPRSAGFPQEDGNYVHPFWDEASQRLYFSSDRENGLGRFDLFYSQKSDDGWSDAFNLGTKVNTKGSEQWPFVIGDTLFFASDGHPGMGGLDIFQATWDTRKWNFVKNMKAPLNSGADDFAYYLKETRTSAEEYQQTGYLSSNRPGGKGSDDIYKYERVVLPPPPVDTVEVPEIVFKLNLEGTVLGKIYADPTNPNSQVTGREPLANTKIQVSIDGETINLNTNLDGKFNMELEVGKEYSFLASKAEYLNNTAELSTEDVVLTEVNPIQVLTLEITLDPLFRNVDIVLPNIYYDFEKWDIRADAEPTLNELATILKNNPLLKIQLASHTDCRGGDDYNKNLSQKRADSAIDFLNQKGIAVDRLQALGAGETTPANDCACQRCSEEEHQENRRTTFRILE